MLLLRLLEVNVQLLSTGVKDGKSPDILQQATGVCKDRVVNYCFDANECLCIKTKITNVYKYVDKKYIITIV